MGGWVGVNRTKKSNRVFAIGAEGYRLLQLNMYIFIYNIFVQWNGLRNLYNKIEWQRRRDERRRRKDGRMNDSSG